MIDTNIIKLLNNIITECRTNLMEMNLDITLSTSSTLGTLPSPPGG